MSRNEDADINRGLGGQEAEARSSTMTSFATTPASGLGRKRVVFPLMLHRLLDESEANGAAHVVSWLPCGRAFKVHTRDAFTKDVLPKYYRQTRYKSFVRQLNLWGFHCISEGVDKGSYTHVSFVRGDSTKCEAMRRVKIKGHSAVHAVASAKSSADGHLTRANASAGDVIEPFSSAEDVNPPDEPIAADSAPSESARERKIRVVIAAPAPEQPVANDSPSGDLAALPPTEDDWLYRPRTSRDEAPLADRVIALEHHDAVSPAEDIKMDGQLIFPIGDIPHDGALRLGIGEFHFPMDCFDEDLDFELFQF